MNKAAPALALLLAGLALAAAAATTGSRSWSIEPARSQAQFGVRKFWFAHARGTFPGVRGDLRRIDTHLGADLVEVDAVIDVASLVMDDAADREHALGPNFFDAERHPQIRFDSDPFPLEELTTGGPLRGMLHLHGESHPVTFLLEPSDCPRQPLLCIIHVRGTLSRRAFGMRAWRGVIGDRVELGMRIFLADTR